MFFGLFDLPVFMDQLCPCTNVFLTAYAHVRTEPQCDIGQTRGKKIGILEASIASKWKYESAFGNYDLPPQGRDATQSLLREAEVVHLFTDGSLEGQDTEDWWLVLAL